MTSQLLPPIKAVKTIRAVSVNKVVAPTGVTSWVYDFAQVV